MDAPNDLELLEQILARQPVEVRERLARRYFTPSAIARARLTERDGRIRANAIGRPGPGRDVAADIHQDLQRYREGTYRFERDRPPADPRRASLHQILTINRGKAPSKHTIRRILAGLGGSKTAPAMIQQPREDVRNGKLENYKCVGS